MKGIKFDFNDILIVPATVSKISTRTTINPFDENGFLPLITAPMDTVINEQNQGIFFKNKINTCLPRGEESSYLFGFESISLSDFDSKFIDTIQSFEKRWILIDIANGHMEKLIKSVISAKKIYGSKLVLMVGNVANSEAYANLSKAGADYIRVGIGNGGGCLTTQQLGVGYPMGSLIEECYYSSLNLDTPAKIVADGGMKNYSDIIKALALGADYVMVGSILNKALESCGDNYVNKWYKKNVKVSDKVAKKYFNSGKRVFKYFRGMSTKEVQKKWGKSTLKTSEGVIRYNEVEYTLEGWVNNFESYLRSAMSYTNASSLSEFCGMVDYVHISENAYKRFNK